MFLDLKARKIIPRWRNFQTTAALGELDSPRAAKPTAFESLSLAETIRDFSLNPTPWIACDLLSAAFVVGRQEDAIGAAKYIVENQNLCPASAVALARRLSEPSSEDWPIPDVEDETAEILQRRIHAVRMRLHEQPRNSIQWVELARLYTIAGQWDHAERAMRIACALSPSNRFVLRAAARFFTHIRAPGAALRILRDAGSVRKDPWLLAAEVGVATVAGSSPRFAKAGFALVEGKQLPDFSITELASSLATLELCEGSAKKAKKYFRRSLVSPTENSVAQAEWASQLLGGLEVDVQAYCVPRPFEAQAFDNFNKGKWQECMEWSRKWYLDQAFSARPAILASYVSSGALERYMDSISIIERALSANPGDPPLLNNLAFAYASLGNTPKAEQVISNLDVTKVSTASSITLRATKGLICFRKGEIEEGRRLYMDAMDVAKKQHILSYRAMAASYLAREEILARTENSATALKRAVAEARGQHGPDVAEILRHVLQLAEEHNVTLT